MQARLLGGSTTSSTDGSSTASSSSSMMSTSSKCLSKFSSPFKRKPKNKTSNKPATVADFEKLLLAPDNSHREEMLRLFILKLDEEANYFQVSASPEEELCDCQKCQVRFIILLFLRHMLLLLAFPTTLSRYWNTNTIPHPKRA